MTVTPIPHEPGRFFVSSSSRPQEHTVDLFYQEEPNVKPRPFCGCENSMCRGHVCKHIIAVIASENARLNLCLGTRLTL